MNINQLYYFLSVAEELSFTKAAQKQHVAQTAISRQIKTLEDELGVILFQRTTKSVSLTAAGKAYYEDVKLILRLLEGAGNRARQLGTGESKTFTVGFTSLCDTPELSHLLHAFRAKYTNTVLTLYHDDSAKQLTHAVQRGDVDIAFFFSFQDILPPPDCCWENFGSYPGVVLCPQNHPLANRKTITMKELHQECLISFEDIDLGHIPEVYVEPIGEAGINEYKVVLARDMESLVKMVEAGVGLALLPVQNLARFSEQIRLIPLKYHQDGPKKLMIWHQDNVSPLLPPFQKMALEMIPKGTFFPTGSTKAGNSI